MCVCVCVCVFSSHSFWTSSSLDVPAGVTQEEGHIGFLIHLLSAVRALIFLARRIQPFLFLLCTNDLIVLHPLGIFILFFSFLVRKIPFAGIELTSQRVRGLRGTSELPGRPATIMCVSHFLHPLLICIDSGHDTEGIGGGTAGGIYVGMYVWP